MVTNHSKVSKVDPVTLPTGHSIRLSSRTNAFKSPTTGLAPGYLQANLLILPSQYARDFRLLCHRNPVPCPLLAESAAPGSFDALKSHIPGIAGEQLAQDLDLRRDAPAYTIYEDGIAKAQGVGDIVDYWTQEHVAFLVGCSFSFENALVEAGLPPVHILQGRNVAMYRTKVPLNPAGVFKGASYVVSMRPYRRREVERVRDVTRPYVRTHGEPVAWGWEAVDELGIGDIGTPEWGDKPLWMNGHVFGKSSDSAQGAGEDEVVPVFWGCGVTPQEAVMKAGIGGIVMGHQPGCMLVLDVKEEELLKVG